MMVMLSRGRLYLARRIRDDAPHPFILCMGCIDPFLRRESIVFAPLYSSLKCRAHTEHVSPAPKPNQRALEFPQLAPADIICVLC